MLTLDQRFKRLGFNVGISYQVFIKDLSGSTSLVVEGARITGYPTYRYSFYKVTYLPDGAKAREKIYVENESASRVLRRVTSFLDFMERSEASGE
ncbi:hypothetical protein [Geomicrobium sp. JCM 19055]|uniref:hypothetical protein n=1 Tax=Geomicrobium sp. JCM 19055 TaxID=1460649 RepID=UPI00045ED3F6|nr:hypothetical protein [Geomicrobium sp. JCM 19055]GAJ99571.1 hypothetical protein JCM19055_2579 [Geomicrobium sp. JCM 19055]